MISFFVPNNRPLCIKLTPETRKRQHDIGTAGILHLLITSTDCKLRHINIATKVDYTVQFFFIRSQMWRYLERLERVIPKDLTYP